jgi:hypothetical protein
MNQFHYEIEINVDMHDYLDKTRGKWIPVEYGKGVATYDAWDKAKEQAKEWFVPKRYRIVKVEKIETEKRTTV